MARIPQTRNRVDPEILRQRQQQFHEEEGYHWFRRSDDIPGQFICKCGATRAFEGLGSVNETNPAEVAEGRPTSSGLYSSSKQQESHASQHSKVITGDQDSTFEQSCVAQQQEIHTTQHCNTMDEDPTLNTDQPPAFHQFSDLPTELQDKVWEIHENEPKYTRDALVAIFTAFYTFMTTKLLPSDAMKVPPLGGWPDITPKRCRKSGKTDFAIDVLRHLPYLEQSGHGDNTHNIHYKCEVIDYYASLAEDLDVRGDGEEYIVCDLENKDEDAPYLKHIVMIAAGYESGGRDMYLDTKTGEMIVEELRCDHDTTCDVREYFDWLKEQYLSLNMIKLPGEDTIENAQSSDHLGEVDEATVFAQTDGFYCSDLDQQWIKQIYKAHGWPHDFRKEECMAAIREFIDRRNEREG